jgi:hypothetical protein
MQLHGSIHALAVGAAPRPPGSSLAPDRQASLVVAVTELGDMRALDLSLLEVSYCDFLASLWASVDVVWEGGRTVARAPPTGHPCSAAIAP